MVVGYIYLYGSLNSVRLIIFLWIVKLNVNVFFDIEAIQISFSHPEDVEPAAK